MVIEKGVQAFPRSEYLRRMTAAKAEMAQRDVDVFVVVDPANIAYLTGYTAVSAYVPQALVLTLDAEEPIFVLRQMDVGAAIHESFLSRESIVGYSENLVGNPDQDGYDAIIDAIHEFGSHVNCVGLEMAPLKTHTIEKFQRRLPSAGIQDVSDVITWLRLVKSDLEIELMRQAAAISDAGVRKASEVLRAGVSESEAAAAIISQLILGANGYPSTGLAVGFFLCATPRTGTAHVPWTDNVLRDGSQVNLELGGVRYGYTAPIMRTFSIGPASDRLRRVHDAEVAGLEAALAAVEPGRTCGDVADAFYKAARAHGLEKESRCGYAVGINWLEPTASLKTGDPTVLQPNMTFHLMLGNWIQEDYGYVISETFRVTETGADVLTKSSRDLLELS